MNVSSVDNEKVVLATNGKLLSEVTHINLKGPRLEIEGYATIEGINSYQENRTRKVLLIVPSIDISAYRDRNFELADKTNDEIMDSITIKAPLDNCLIADVYEETEDLSEEFASSLGGFKGSIDLSTISKGRPLEAGEFHIFISLEQLDEENDFLKHHKVIPLSTSPNFHKDNVLTTRLEYFSNSLVLKYSLMLSFDNYSKNLKLKNNILQSYDPRKLQMDEVPEENRRIRALKNRLFRMFYFFFCLFPIQKTKVIFASDSRVDLSGNFFFVYEEILERDMNLDIKFLFNERIGSKRTIVDLVKTAYHFATAKIILLDDFYPMIYPLKIRKKADLIQIWHAAGAFKTFGFSRLGRPGGPSPLSKNHRNYTKAAVSSEGIRGNYAEGFGISEDKVYATGLPRADIFFDEEYKEYVKTSLHAKYPFMREKKVILFAPTFRGNGQASAHYPYEHLDMEELYNALGEEYVFVMKIHPFVKNKITIPYEYSEFFVDLSEYREINDLLLVTDILITDYSSVCFEFALLNKPMLFFAFDVEEYIASRDFYYDYFSFIPGPLLRTTKEIISTIKNEQFQLEKIPPFVKYFFNDTLGKASKNVVDQLIIPSLNNEHLVDDQEKVILPPAKSRKELFDRSIQMVD
ncbi:CDP-glycerol glycerophosphotransferase family protein [Planomicrobium sp. CPCC 101079]|uniref:CDP-glycerol glycerophosphotransferase family protein n=1 Tax=Planomicrobium sp. CPCC 101079 TaxID=2599618 RepID=UPI0011B67D74|nr:CDP-glycerol glycerophosphotransferase family protein [Planomicrobium sp. CPCC 101079]TWT03573.1 polyribitolphosphotransferase [Planomicrobium sp. CPCC 101079]